MVADVHFGDGKISRHARKLEGHVRPRETAAVDNKRARAARYGVRLGLAAALLGGIVGAEWRGADDHAEGREEEPSDARVLPVVDDDVADGGGGRYGDAHPVVLDRIGRAVPVEKRDEPAKTRKTAHTRWVKREARGILC